MYQISAKNSEINGNNLFFLFNNSFIFDWCLCRSNGNNGKVIEDQNNMQLEYDIFLLPVHTFWQQSVTITHSYNSFLTLSHFLPQFLQKKMEFVFSAFSSADDIIWKILKLKHFKNYLLLIATHKLKKNPQSFIHSNTLVIFCLF